MLSKVIDPIMKYHLWESIPHAIRLCEDCKTPKIHGFKKAGDYCINVQYVLASASGPVRSRLIQRVPSPRRHTSMSVRAGIRHQDMNCAYAEATSAPSADATELSSWLCRPLSLPSIAAWNLAASATTID